MGIFPDVTTTIQSPNPSHSLGKWDQPTKYSSGDDLVTYIEVDFNHVIKMVCIKKANIRVIRSNLVIFPHYTIKRFLTPIYFVNPSAKFTCSHHYLYCGPTNMIHCSLVESFLNEHHS